MRHNTVIWPEQFSAKSHFRRDVATLVALAIDLMIFKETLPPWWNWLLI
jgi:hypothetical protein